MARKILDAAKEAARKIAYMERLEVGKAVAQFEIKKRAEGRYAQLFELQAAGYRRQIRAEKSAGAIFGVGADVIFAVYAVGGIGQQSAAPSGTCT